MANFKTIDDLIKAQIGTAYDPFVLESLEKDTVAGLPEPVPVYMVKAADTDPDVTGPVLINSKFSTSGFTAIVKRSDRAENYHTGSAFLMRVLYGDFQPINSTASNPRNCTVIGIPNLGIPNPCTKGFVSILKCEYI